MGLASCNNALGYWHYPGDANIDFENFVPEEIYLETHAEFIWLFIFTRNAWLQLVGGQVLSWWSWYIKIVFLIQHCFTIRILRCENLSLKNIATWCSSNTTYPPTSQDVSTKFHINYNRAKKCGHSLICRTQVSKWATGRNSASPASSAWLGRAAGQPDTLLLPMICSLWPLIISH